MKRDAPIPAEALAYYQTPATPPSTWRAEIGRVGMVCGVTFVAGAFLTGTSVILWRSWQTVGVGAWLTGLAIVAYLLWYAWRVHSDVSARHNLDLARMYAEQDALYAVDINRDGKADVSEIDAMINYVRRLREFGEPTTSRHAQQTHSIDGPTWTRYKNWLIRNGYANQVNRRGGAGFALKPSVMRTPWPRLEQQLRQRLLAGLGDGMTINDAPPPRRQTERVSTLDD